MSSTSTSAAEVLSALAVVLLRWVWSAQGDEHSVVPVLPDGPDFGESRLPQECDVVVKGGDVGHAVIERTGTALADEFGELGCAAYGVPPRVPVLGVVGADSGCPRCGDPAGEPAETRPVRRLG